VRFTLLFILVFLSSCNSGAPTPAADTTPKPTAAQRVELEPFKLPVLSDSPIVVEAFLGNDGWTEPQLASLPEFGKQFNPLRVSEPSRQYSSRQFAVFLPAKTPEVGDSWPVPKELAVEFLSQFPGTPIAEMNIDGSGAYATFRAVSNDSMEIALRVHAQFRFDGEIFLNPAQFAGRLILNRATGDVAHFSLAVPSDHETNLDFEVLGGSSYTAGVRFIPRMELIGGRTLSDLAIRWSEEISEEQAKHQMAELAYPCNQIAWVPLEKLSETAKRRKTPIFAIVMEGVLNDQSC
jgi:hypothetical protein